jgi:hypothetical protein
VSTAAAGAPSSRRGPTSAVVAVSRGELAPLAHDRLVKALGDRRAGEVFTSAYASFGDRPLDTPQDLLEFGEILIRLGGLIQAVGRALKVQALLRGAVER